MVATLTTLNKGSSISKVLQTVKERQEARALPLTCFYYKEGKLIGSYFCSDEEGDFVLFINKDYSDSTYLMNFIEQHCQFFNDSVEVYFLDQKGTELYRAIHPMHTISVDL